MDSNELELVRSSVQHLVANCTPATFTTDLAEMGWADLYDAEPEAAVSVLADEVGRAAAAAPLLSTVLAQALGLAGTVVLPPLARSATLGWPGVVAGADLTVNGLLEPGDDGTALLVPTAAGVVQVPAGSLQVQPTGTGDPTLGLRRVSGVVPSGPVLASAQQWAAALAIGRRALASALTGLGGRMLHDATEYVKVRQQFGRPIGSFQTVKHRLADVHVAVSAASAGTATAWSDDDEWSSIAALCLATKASRLAATHCHQVHGGIAFTTEHGFHRLIRRGQSWLGMLGHPDDLTRLLGEHLVATSAVPRTPQLTLAHHG
mgnify:CR=1 FL=1